MAAARSPALDGVRHGQNGRADGDRVEKLLNHVSGSFGGVAGVYQRHDFADEKRRALEGWAAHLRSLETGDEAANIVPFELKAHAT